MSYKRALEIDVNDPADTLPDLIRKREEIRIVYNKFYDSEQARGGDSLLWRKLETINSRISKCKDDEMFRKSRVNIIH
jgi:hypothetical protein